MPSRDAGANTKPLTGVVEPTNGNGSAPRASLRMQSDAVRSLRGAMPPTDPAYPILEGIFGVVPASRWTFARVDADGALTSFYCSDAEGTELSRIADEFNRQRMKTPTGPQLCATLGPLDDFASGITLLFADARTTYGILTLLRTAEFGPFTTSEISMLTFALDALSDRLSTLRLHPAFSAADRSTDAGALAPMEGAFYVLDTDLHVVLTWSADDKRRVSLMGLQTQLAARLPTVLENTVRELTNAWSKGTSNQGGVARPVPFLVVRTEPLCGPAGLFIGVHVDRYRPQHSLLGAAERFHISPRELQVLAMLLDGCHLHEIAKQLNITASTAQDHVKNMLHKTHSNNRSELIARVLGWESTPRKHHL